MESQFGEKSSFPRREIFASCTTQARNAIMLQHLIIQFLALDYLSSGHPREVKNKSRKFQTFSCKSNHGRLREVNAYKGFHR